MVSFEIFVKAMPPSLLELKVLPSFCFAFKIPDDVAASKVHVHYLGSLKGHIIFQKIHVRLQPGIRLHGILVKNVREMKN